MTGAKRSFTIPELLVVVILVAALAALAIVSYSGFLEKSRSAEALANIGAIKRAETIYKMESGVYVGADNADEINERLSVQIIPKYYEYRIVGATADNFLVIAKRIGEDLALYTGPGTVPSDTAMLAMDQSGSVRNDDVLSGIASSGGSTGGDGWGGAGGITSWTGAGGGMGGGAGGGGGGGGGGGVGGGVGGGTTTVGGGIVLGGYQVVYDSSITGSLGVLSDSAFGNYYATLITTQNIPITWATTTALDGALADYNLNTSAIRVLDSLQTTWSESAIAALICHEATHADYHINPVARENETQARHPEVRIASMHISRWPYDSIDQEYMCFVSSVQVWQEAKSETEKNIQMDYWSTAYAQGEDYMKATVRELYPQFVDPTDPSKNIEY